jgi:hypothetical protein
LKERPIRYNFEYEIIPYQIDFYGSCDNMGLGLKDKLKPLLVAGLEKCQKIGYNSGGD